MNEFKIEPAKDKIPNLKELNEGYKKYSAQKIHTSKTIVNDGFEEAQQREIQRENFLKHKEQLRIEEEK